MKHITSFSEQIEEKNVFVYIYESEDVILVKYIWRDEFGRCYTTAYFKKEPFDILSVSYDSEHSLKSLFGTAAELINRSRLYVA